LLSGSHRDLARQETPFKQAERNETNAELPQEGNDILLGLTPEQ